MNAATTTLDSLSTVEMTKRFGGVTAVDAATVTFQEGKVNGLIGPNGSGKTTFFNCVTGMIKPDSGTVTFKDRDITGKAPHAIAHAGIGRSFQLCRIFPRMSVLDNVLVAVRRTGICIESGTKTKSPGSPGLLIRKATGQPASAYFRWSEISLVISNIDTCALPPKTAFSLSSALIMRRFDASCRFSFLM